MEDKRDPYNAKKAWEEWKIRNKIIEGINKDNSDLILRCLGDLEVGKNINKTKGSRSPIRLISLQCRLVFFARLIKDKRFIEMTKDDIHKILKDMRDGKIKKTNSKGEETGNYSSVDSYLKDFKVLWNWLLKTKQVQANITEDLGKEDKKPPWVYLTEEQFKTLANHCSVDYRGLMWLMLDAGTRVTESYSIRVNDFSEDFKQLTIREETSKNKYGRTVHLKLCSDLIKEYVKFHELKNDDFLFQKTPQSFNKYLKRLSRSLFGNKISHPKAKGTYDKYSLLDNRHNSAVFWLKRYKSQSQLMYRMGWHTEKFVRYYSEYISLNDKISDEDMILEADKGKLIKLEMEIEKIKKQMKKYKWMYKEMKKLKNQFANDSKNFES